MNLDSARGGLSTSETALLDRIGVRCAVPIALAGGDGGGILLGARADGRPYTSDDLHRVETLAWHAAVAFDNALAWEQVQKLKDRLEEENRELRDEVVRHRELEGIVGDSPGLLAALAQIERAAPSQAPVLLLGESGTGKELLARAIHRLSPRRDGPLVTLACAAVPETLFESELFGHAKGAFSGATTAREGRIEAAHRGTLFLDDVDTLPMAVQAKLLRALQEGEVQRLGSAEPRVVDVRVVAATNRELLREIAAGRFREDLYYRLSVVPIEIPPLRERGGDVLVLAEYFAERASKRLGRTPKRLAPAAREALLAYSWPGNIRELGNMIERSVVLSEGDEIELEAPLEDPMRRPPSDRSPRPGRSGLHDQLRDLKEELVRQALAASDGNQARAAALLGMKRQNLHRLISELGLAEGSKSSDR